LNRHSSILAIVSIDVNTKVTISPETPAGPGGAKSFDVITAIEAMDGELQLIARFPNGSVEIFTIAPELEDPELSEV
jgi:hypothetical protein